MRVNSAADLAALIPAVTAFLMAVGWLTQKVRRLIRVMETLNAVVTRELTPNHGGSMKDDVHGTAVSTHELEKRVDALSDALADHLRRSDLRARLARREALAGDSKSNKVRSHDHDDTHTD